MYKHFAHHLVCSLCVFIFSASSAFGQNGGQSEQTENTQKNFSRELQVAEINDLASFVNGILVGHPELGSAEAARDEAMARERQASRPIYNPELEADYEDAVDETYSIGLSQTIDWAGKRDAAYAVSTSERDAADAIYFQKRNAIAANILQDLSDFWAAQAFQQLANTNKAIMSDFAQQAGMRYQAGDIMRVEYETAQLAYAEARMRLAEADAYTTELANGLIAFGAPVNPIGWPAMPTELPEHILGAPEINAIVENLPKVRAARAEVKGAEAAVNLAEAQKRPDPTIGIRAGEEDDESLVGVSFSIPLFVRNNFDDDVMAAISAKSKIEADADTVTRLARAELTVSVLRFSTMREAWVDWEKVSSVSMETQTKVLTRLWEARELSMSEFLLQYRQTLEAQRTAVELRQTLWESWIDFVRQSNQVEHWLTTASVVQTADELRGLGYEY